MTKILATSAILATAAFLALPLSADAAPQSRAGAQTDQSAKMATDISAHRRHYVRAVHHGRSSYYVARPLPYYWGPPVSYGYGTAAGFYASWNPYPYYAYTHAGTYHHAHLFPYGPWW
jgi:hypothetical protein